jgi:GNAT superfamily N-acetyltransferase
VSIDIHPVRTPQDFEDFVRFPYWLYREDPNWVPPLLSERRKSLHPDHNPFFDHAEVVLWLARRNTSRQRDRPRQRDRQVVGTISSHIDHLHNQVRGESTGMFGFFETVDDYPVAEAMLTTACDWARQRGMTTLKGPFSFSLNQECGLLLRGDPGPPMVMIPHNPDYYVQFCERFGLTKALDLYAYLVDLTRFEGDPARFPAKLLRVTDKVRKRDRFTIRHTSAKTYSDDLQKIKMIYNQAWAENWGFVPLTDAEFDKMEADLKQIFDPDLGVGAEVDGQPAGVGIAIPDINQVLRHLNGRLFPIGWLKALWLLRSIDRSRLFMLGVPHEYRGQGIEAVLFYEVVKAAILKGHKEMEISWILENNDMMNRIIRNLGQACGVYVYRTYRLFQMPI